MENPCCTRCGVPINPEMVYKALTRGKTITTCSDCRANPQKQLGECRPWSGDFDVDLVTPMKDGQLYKPGKRLCGKADCVAEKHIEKPFDFNEIYARVMAQHNGGFWFKSVADKVERELAVGVGERR